MIDENYNQDKEKCLRKYCAMPSYERNILSHGIVSVTSLAVVCLGILKITSPFVAVGAGVMYSCAYFLHQDKKADTMKQQLRINEREMDAKDNEIRCLSVIANTTSVKGGSSDASTGTDTIPPPLEDFLDLEK